MKVSSEDPGAHAAHGRLDELQFALQSVLQSLVFRVPRDARLGDLPLSQMRCLRVLSRHEGQKMQDLADKLELKLPAVSQIVDRLVKRDMIERQADPGDRRVVRLTLTPQARVLVAEAQAERRARLAATLEHLDPPAFVKVVEGLRLLAAAAEQIESGSRPPAVSWAGGDGADPLVEMIAGRTRD